MNDTETCDVERIKYPDGEILPAIPHGEESNARQTDASIKLESEDEDRCPDCHVTNGSYHHPGCTVAECPRCETALATCDCLN